jgi:hypothetical protein
MVVLDGLVLAVEVCLDHDRSSALASYAADAITGWITRIPTSDTPHPPHDGDDSELRVCGCDHQATPNPSSTVVPIPTDMAHLSLVGSAGVTVQQHSIATAHRGYVILQDGLSTAPPRMRYNSGSIATAADPSSKSCSRRRGLSLTANNAAGLVFEGGTELVQRSALLGKYGVRFEHQIVTDFDSIPLF